MKKLIMLAAFSLFTVAPAAYAYNDSGDCADAVVDSCNAKYPNGGDGYYACISGGVNQCIAAYPNNNQNQSTPKIKLKASVMKKLRRVRR